MGIKFSKTDIFEQIYLENIIAWNRRSINIRNWINKNKIKSDVTTPNPGQSVLVVEVRDKLHGALHYWSLEKLEVAWNINKSLYQKQGAIGWYAKNVRARFRTKLEFDQRAEFSNAFA